jgi:cell division septum initiation protein DivIVA
MMGLDPEEVEVFVQMVADDFEEFDKENKALKRKIKECQLEIEALQRTEVEFKKSLEEREVNSFTTEEAEKKGREIILRAKQKAKEIKEIAMKEAMAVEREISRLRSLKKELEEGEDIDLD